MSLFRIKNTDFKIVEATFNGHLSTKDLRWSISISAEYLDGRLLGEEWKPRAYSERILTSPKGSLNKWSDVLNQTIKWESNYNEITGTHLASLYVFEHLDIYASILKLGQSISKNRFEIDWNAKCDVWFGKGFDRGLELVIQTAVDFTGIESPLRDEISSREILRDYISDDDFTFDSGDGLSARPIFRPL